MYKPVRVFPVQTNQLQILINDILAFLFCLCQVMDVNSLADDFRNRHTRIQGIIRVLEHHLHFFFKGPFLLRFQRVYILPFVQNLSVRSVIEADTGTAAGRLAAARFPYHPQRFALINIKGNIVHRF